MAASAGREHLVKQPALVGSGGPAVPELELASAAGDISS